MRRSILLLYFLHGTCWTSENFCTYQPNMPHVKEGDSVAILCTYTYPEDRRGESQIYIDWVESNGRDCDNIKKYFTDGLGNIKHEYKDRISTVHHPGNQTASILIRGLKASDGVTYCCIASTIGHNWHDRYGISLTFTGGKWLSQVEELMAVSGEEMIIPCHYPMETLGEAREVTWYTTDSKLCIYTENNIKFTWSPTHIKDTSRFSLVNFPRDVSLRILSVQRGEHARFCCRVATSKETLESTYSTRVTIADSSSPFSVTQPDTITGHRDKSVTLNCSYSQYSENDILNVNIYWRVGNKTGPYVYHPYKEMVHPGYRGRTGIEGSADLHIRGLRMSDNSTYYCFVMLKLCTGNSKYTNSIQFGKGTRLIVTGKITGNLNDPDEQQLIIVVSASAAAMLVLLCVILIILKVTGVICKKKKM
ncbi:uncharacterized protein RB166_010031 [Leptodactylus fuscus]|uniref:uncharacterized protein LOC142204690 n=1 Tax=Leptodactylus fuscus TaxID=238119 RepID=UPI003F4EDAD0